VFDAIRWMDRDFEPSPYDFKTGLVAVHCVSGWFVRADEENFSSWR